MFMYDFISMILVRIEKWYSMFVIKITSPGHFCVFAVREYCIHFNFCGVKPFAIFVDKQLSVKVSSRKNLDQMGNVSAVTSQAVKMKTLKIVKSCDL